MKAMIIALVSLVQVSSFAETLKVGVYTQVGTVTEFCYVNSAYIFVNGRRVANNSNLGKVFTLDVPNGAKIVLRDASWGRGYNECNRIVVEKADGSEVKSAQTPGTINFEIQL